MLSAYAGVKLHHYTVDIDGFAEGLINNQYQPSHILDHSSDREGNREARAAGFFYRGLSKTELLQSREAIQDYEEALLRVPDFFYSSFNMGVEYVRLEDFTNSLSAFRRSWNSILKAGRGELDDSLLWNRKVFSRDRAYCFFYYGMAAVMCGQFNELEELIGNSRDFTFTQPQVVEARTLFEKIIKGELTREEGRLQVEAWTMSLNEKKSRKKLPRMG